MEQHTSPMPGRNPEADLMSPAALRGTSRNFLLLQGPPGPFFRRLASCLEGIGCQCFHICMSGGDLLDWFPWRNFRLFLRSGKAWEPWFRKVLLDWHITDTVLWGCQGYYHEGILKICRETGSRIWLFDEKDLPPDQMRLIQANNPDLDLDQNLDQAQNQSPSETQDQRRTHRGSNSPAGTGAASKQMTDTLSSASRTVQDSQAATAQAPGNSTPEKALFRDVLRHTAGRILIFPLFPFHREERKIMTLKGLLSLRRQSSESTRSPEPDQEPSSTSRQPSPETGSDLITGSIHTGAGLPGAIDSVLKIMGFGGIRHCTILSRGIRRISGLPLFLEEITAPCVVGWGHKKTAARARKYARRKHLPYVALEDGLIKSVAETYRDSGETLLSLVLDQEGIYYDATSGSSLERQIRDLDSWCTQELRLRARELIRRIVEHRIVKYNTLRSARPVPASLRDLAPSEDRVLLIDQTRNDASISQGLASSNTFRIMLADAVKQFGADNVFLKVHPNVVKGMARGYLDPGEVRRMGVTVLAEEINALDLMSHFRNVWTVTSGTGLEALMSGCRVRCYGVPFYAGYGLTEDMQECARDRRGKLLGRNLTLEELAAAVFYRYSIFISPMTRQRCTPEEALDYILSRRREAAGDTGSETAS